MDRKIDFHSGRGWWDKFQAVYNLTLDIKLTGVVRLRSVDHDNSDHCDAHQQKNARRSAAISQSRYPRSSAANGFELVPVAVSAGGGIHPRSRYCCGCIGGYRFVDSSPPAIGLMLWNCVMIGAFAGLSVGPS